MTSKHKFLYVFLIIITFGLILIYWKKKYRQSSKKDNLSTTTKTAFSIEELIEKLGGKNNIETVLATHKVIKIGLKDREQVNIEALKKLDGISGMTFQSKSISLVVGNVAKYLETKINEEIK
ncbi:PTS glucose transporter subunit IIB [[Mycoplasma] falconis]|uniref:PTS glucose transporter subunit IIB n=1 Tax=[Mycoplasma] falconis TaxID=92403 RepID=A0A501X9Q1_9BACT|nr:PTS glucose transporter subunit IIB [[Mycoplasma] falconis]TPE57206.1 PTS glucose transporter subunit IIB [[Mycoplasma] falconis]